MEPSRGYGVCPLHLEVVVIKGKLLSFNLQQGFDTIKRLGGVLLTESVEVQFLEELTQYAEIKIDEPDFSAVFNQQKEEWTASWKWAGSQTPGQQRIVYQSIPNMKKN